MSANRVFITGLSALTASGNTADETWQSLLQGKSGIDEMTQWDISSWPSRLGGELKNIKPATMLPDKKLMKLISRQDVLGIHAAVKAVEHSQLIAYRDGLNDDEAMSFNDATAIYVGSPGNKYFQQYDFLPLLAKTKDDMQAFAHQLFDVVHPMWLLRILPNNVLAYTGITYGFKGPNHNITNHAVGGAQALIEAYHALRSGQADRAVVVAYDTGIEPQALFYYDQLGVVSHHHLKPFDKSHDGTILAEGASAMVLETEASVKARGARCYGECLGGMAATESAGLFSIHQDGQPLVSLMTEVLNHQNMDASDIDIVVAHGNGNALSDDSEASAIYQVFKKVPVTAFKWSMGHTLCASGLLDSVLATMALQEKCLPGIANFESPTSTSELLNLSASHRDIDSAKTAMVINRGFASMNACLIIKSCDA